LKRIRATTTRGEGGREIDRGKRRSKKRRGTSRGKEGLVRPCQKDSGSLLSLKEKSFPRRGGGEKTWQGGGPIGRGVIACFRGKKK